MEETEDKMASLTINVDATRKLLELRNLDVDQIRREGRCCEVLRSIRDDAEQFANRLRNAPNARNELSEISSIALLETKSEYENV